MDGHAEMALLGENFDPGVAGRMREGGYESRSGSDNFEGASGDDQDAGDDGPPRKKKYHRHTPHQIQELESYGLTILFEFEFKEFVLLQFCFLLIIISGFA